MTTIAEMVIRASVDPGGVRDGLNKSLDLMRDYSASAARAMKSAKFEDTAQDAARHYVFNLEKEFRAQHGRLKEALFSGQIDERVYKEQAQRNAAAYNASLIAGIREMRGNGTSDKDLLPLFSAFKGGSLGNVAKDLDNVHLAGMKVFGTLRLLGQAAAGGLFLRAIVRESVESQKSIAQLEAAVESTGHAAGKSVAEMDAYSSALERTSTFSDEAIKSAQGILLTFTSIRGQRFDQATAAVVDLATRMGGDLTGAALQVGKALQDPAQGLTALRRSGVSFTDEQVKLIKSLQDTGHAAQAQDIILRELQKEFGGSAMAARDTLGGALQYLSNQWGNTLEVSKQGSAGIATAINSIADGLPAVREQIDNFFAGISLSFLDAAITWTNIRESFSVDPKRSIAALVLGGTGDYATMFQATAGIAAQSRTLVDALEALRKEEEDKLLGLNKPAAKKGVVPPGPGGDADEQWKTHIETIKDVVEAYKLLEGEHAVTHRVGLALLTTYQQVSDEIAHMSDLTSKHAVELMKLRAEMEQTNMVAALSGTPGLQLTRSGAAALAGAPSDAVKTAAELLDRAKLLEEAGRGATAEYTRTIAALRILDGYLESANNREGLTNERLRQQLAIRERLNAENARHGLITDPNLVDPSIRGMVESAQRAATLARGARDAGASNAAQLERDANAERERALTMIRNIVRSSADWGNMTETERKALASLVDLLKDLNVETDKSANGWAAIGVGLRGIVDAAGALGKIPQQLRDGVNAAEHLVASIHEIKKAKDAANKTGGDGWSTANVLSAVGGAVGAAGAVISLASTIGSLFSAHDEALERNTARLVELRAALQQTRGVAGQEGTAGAVDKLVETLSGTRIGSSASIAALQQFEKDLRAVGVTVDQMKQMAADLGIELSGSKESYAQFADALRLAIIAAGKFADTLDDQKALRDLHNKVYGTTSPTDQLKTTLDLLGQFAPKIRDQLGDLDVSTAEGRQALRTALQHLVDEIEAGALTPEELGRLKGVKDLAGLIDSLVTGLDSLSSAASTAAAAINNVSWYKVNRAIYDIAPVQMPATSPALSAPGESSGTWSPIPASDTHPSIVIAGDVNLVTPETDPEKMFRDVQAYAQRRSQTYFGTTRRAGEVPS